MKKQSGFTLIELMVVMAIIAILATAGLTAYSNYIKKARDSARIQTARQIMTAVESLASGGVLPTQSALSTYLANEGFAYTLPTMNSLIARASGIVDNILGTTFAALEDPFGPSSGPCLAEPDPGTTGGMKYGYCAFAYTRYSDGTYTIMHGIEHEDNKNNFWSATHHGLIFYGEVIGTNPYIVAANSGLSSGFTDSNGSMINTNQIKSISEQIEGTQLLPSTYFADGYSSGVLSPFTSTDV